MRGNETTWPERRPVNNQPIRVLTNSDNYPTFLLNICFYLLHHLIFSKAGKTNNMI